MVFESFEIILQVFLSVILGSLIGLEREYKGKTAGLRTYGLVTLGACLFTIISFQLFYFFLTETGVSFDPSRIIQAVAIGIGFIGAGVIFQQSSGPRGLTTAAGLWVTAAIGVAVGAKLYLLSLVGTLLAIFILSGLKIIEERKLKK